MKIRNIPLPEIYTSSQDFRFFLDWISTCLEKTQEDIENLIDLYDPLRCPSELLWMLGDTMGFKFDNRFCYAYNRLVMLYFMSMIYNRGSITGMTIAANLNLAQFNINKYGEENSILYERLEDTSIPVNSANIIPHVREGYIDVVYVSTQSPENACIEYVRPLGMYMFEHHGVELHAGTRISVDARLANMPDIGVATSTPTHIGRYTRDDYARLQKMENEEQQILDSSDTRKPVWASNSAESPDSHLNPGYRTLYSMQLSNNEHVVDALLTDPKTNQPIFSLGFRPQDVEDVIPDSELTYDYLHSAEYRQSEDYAKSYNLRYNLTAEQSWTSDVYTTDEVVPGDVSTVPRVNDVMSAIGDVLDAGPSDD